MARRAVKPRRRMGERSGRPRRPKISPLTIAKIDYVDYKDTELLNKFVSERAKLKPRLNSGNDAQQQRTVARAVKNAREMALLPYTSRLTTQRRERRGERGTRAAGPPPRPTAPPPGSSGEQGRHRCWKSLRPYRTTRWRPLRSWRPRKWSKIPSIRMNPATKL